ncbi:HAMP domain-containing histidine kinase [Myxococcota bacterium]|nr:HAMP domain-containing histidine kinase [Myxococcota bacterium]
MSAPLVRRVALGVGAIYAAGTALAVQCVPFIIELESAASAWVRGLSAYGLLMVALLLRQTSTGLAPLTSHPPGADARRRAAHDLPFTLARLAFVAAVLGGALTWPYLTRFSALTLPQALAGAVTTYLLLALPVIFIYDVARRLLRDEAAGEGALPDALRQPLGLRVALAVQLPIIVCMAGLVLVEQSNAQRHSRDVNTFFERQYTQVLARALTTLPDVEDRHAVFAAIEPPPGITLYTDPEASAPDVPGAAVGVVVDPDRPRPLTLRLPPLVLFAAVALFAALLGRWLAREVTAEVAAARQVLLALQRPDPPPPTHPAGTTMAETTALVGAWRATLEGFRARRDALDRATHARRAAEQAKARFLAHLSHELKSPLNTILGFSEILLTGLDGPLTPRQRERLGILWRAGEGLLRFILSLLDLARLDAADATVATDVGASRVDAEDLAAAVREQWRTDPEGGIRLEIAIADDARDASSLCERSRTARALVLCAGTLLDAVETGTARVTIARLPGGTPATPGGLRCTVSLGDHRAEPADARRLALQVDPRGTGQRMSAAATALALVSRIVALQAGRLAVELPGTPDGGAPWPRYIIDLPA